MNGVDEEMFDRRPLVTCAGELEVFSSLEDNLTQALPQESTEWKRSLGRPTKSVYISANFTPFSSEGLPKCAQWDLVRYPLFHIYWTECVDLDVYKSTLKEDIENWLRELNARDIQDWLIIVIENYDGRSRANKLLPRTTVLDKIRADFAPKQGDRCISVINPGKAEPTESWKGLVNRIRHLLLVAYGKAVSRLEDYVRQKRERRNDPGWNFMNYFKLQEELAQVLEMLGLYDEALVQYDELDALFSQFVVNGFTCETISWLRDFQGQLEKWNGVKLGPMSLSKKPSLLELRAYLFSRQAQMLMLTEKIWEIASRCLPFLHNCTRELTILEVTAPDGALECWLFLAAMEVLQTCDKFNHADEVEVYSMHTAPLWAYASQKLKYLGELCGLLPGYTPTSEQLHIVVGLSAGMGDNPGTPISPSPTDKLKEALCSKDVFNKTYLEMAEQAMGTYKHVGRIRSARLVGREVASFYMMLGETQKAAAFLSDALRTFQQDGWRELIAQTQIELAECHKKACDWRKFIRSAIYVASAIEIDTLIRWSFFDEMRKYFDKLDGKPLVVPFNDTIKLVAVSLKNPEVVMQDETIEIECIIESNFPREVLCTNVIMSLENEPKDEKKKKDKCCLSKNLTSKDMKEVDSCLRKLHIQRHLDYKQDKQLASASVTCNFNQLKRKSSVAPTNSDFRFCLQVSKLPFLMSPGLNVIRLSRKATEVGRYHLGQLAFHVGQLQLISQPIMPALSVEIQEEAPSVHLLPNSPLLLSGIEQKLFFVLTIGSYHIDPTWKIKLTASRGLGIQIDSNKPLSDTVEIEVGKQELYSSVRHHLLACADMNAKDCQIIISCPWIKKPQIVSFSFTAPLTCSWKLQTVGHRKFVQINLVGQCKTDLAVTKPSLMLTKGCEAVNKNNTSSSTLLDNLTYTYVWEIIFDPKFNSSSINAEFNITYQINGMSNAPKLFKYLFEIKDFKTLYVLEADLEPSKGSEFCRVDILCHLNVTISYVGAENRDSKTRSIMYEVLAEQSVWAVCGRTAGVVSFESKTEKEKKEPQKVVLDVMPLRSGYLPLPLVRISKYIPAEVVNEKSGKCDIHPRLEPFNSGQVYNASKGKQVHVIITVNNGNS